MKNAEVRSLFLCFSNLLFVRVTWLFSGWQNWHTKGSCFTSGMRAREGPERSSRERQFCSLVSLLPPKAWTISITGYILHWVPPMLENSSPPPKVVHSISIRIFMHLFKEYWLSTYCYISGIAFGVGNAVVNETDELSYFLQQEIDNKQRNDYTTCLTDTGSVKKNKTRQMFREWQGCFSEWPRKVLKGEDT